MKFKIEIDIEDLINDIEADDKISFTGYLERNIQYAIKQQIMDTWGKEIVSKFDSMIKAEIEKSQSEVINNMVQSTIKEFKVAKWSSGHDRITIEEYIKNKAEDIATSDIYKTPLMRMIETHTEKSIEALQKRYDMAFAAQIITKLNENKMLKEDIASLLLTD